MVADSAAVAATFCYGCGCTAADNDFDWLTFLSGISVGCLATLLIIWLVSIQNSIRCIQREDDELEPLRSSFWSTAEATAVSLDNSDSDKEIPSSFDVNVTNRVLGALKDHLKSIDTEQEIESLGKLRISYEPSRRASADYRMDLSSVLRRWSVSNESGSFVGSPHISRMKGEITPKRNSLSLDGFCKNDEAISKCNSLSPEMIPKRISLSPADFHSKDEMATKNKSFCCSSDKENCKATPHRPDRTSVSFEDGINTNNCDNEDCAATHFQKVHNGFDIEPVGDVKIEVVSEEGWFADDDDIMQAREFDQRILSKISSLEESRMYLRRTRAVSMLSSRLMAAPDEKTCYEIVSRLLVPLFHVDRISYVLMKDADNMLVKQITVNKKEHMVMGLDKGFLGGGRWEDGGYLKPLKGTAVEVCSKTLKPHYCPNIKESPFVTQRQISTMGVNSILATPILVNGNKFIGCIMICMVEVDGIKEYDRILVQDIAKKLGVNIYAKRIKHSLEMSSKITREMLHSMIPPCVIEKISCYWDEGSEEFKRRRSSVSSSSKPRRSSFSRIKCDGSHSEGNVGEKIHLLSKMYRQESSGEEIGTLVETDESDFPLTTTKALYAENVDDVCIIFADIVGFSRISLELEPIVVVNMLQDLFSRFDELCDMHNVQKLETIGDAYIATVGIGRDSSNSKESVKDSAVRILKMAKDMVRQARHVLVPTPGGFFDKNSKLFDSLEIRVGVHVGNVTCGVLGQRLPKMTVFGNAVNLAARMEQTSLPSHIRVTKDFYDLVSDVENQWDKRERIEIKNMGTMMTYLLDPLKILHPKLLDDSIS